MSSAPLVSWRDRGLSQRANRLSSWDDAEFGGCRIDFRSLFTPAIIADLRAAQDAGAAFEAIAPVYDTASECPQQAGAFDWKLLLGSALVYSAVSRFVEDKPGHRATAILPLAGGLFLLNSSGSK